MIYCRIKFYNKNQQMLKAAHRSLSLLVSMPMNAFCNAKIPIESIKRLRQQTSAPLSQCKVALEESNNDHASALLWLKEKGLAAASKRSSRETREGVIGAMVTGCRSKVAIVEVNCETDFVAKNQLFLSFVNNVMVRAIQQQYVLDYQQGQQDEGGIQAFLEDSQGTQLFPEDTNVNNLFEQYKLVSSRLQQNIRVRRVVTLHSDKYKYGVYVHQAHKDFVGLQATIAQLQVEPELDENNQEQLEEFGQFADNIATQVLGSPPQYFNIDQIPKDKIEQQTNKVKQQMKGRLEKAPEHTHQKIIQGKLNASFYSQVLLHKMPYILSNDGILVEKYWEETEKQLNRKFKLNRTLTWECK